MIMNPPHQAVRPVSNRLDIDLTATSGAWGHDDVTRLGGALTRFKHQHAWLLGGAVALLAASLSALALAVSPLTPDFSDVPPRRLVQEAVQPLDVMPQLEALADHPLEFSHTLTVRGPDSLGALLARAGLHDAGAAAKLWNEPAVKAALSSRGVRSVDLRAAPDGSLQQLRVRQAAEGQQALSHFQLLTARRDQGNWVIQEETKPLSMTPRFASGSIRSSLFAATDAAALPDAVAIQLAEIFSGDIDFHRELRKGDRFSLVYEALTADGEPVAWNQGSGRILAAEFVNAGRVHQAIWFQAASADSAEYFDAEGRARKRAFLASPLEFSRVTSGFELRLHPILKEWRAHRGLDYGAPIGTPVRSVADGVVKFAGVQGGYGNVVEVEHTKDRSTLYAHLSSINVREGQRISQGATVGAVGSTGMSTGPHLHFEFRVAGAHQDPQLIAKQTGGLPLEGTELTQFAGLAQAMKTTLDWAADLGASAGRATFE